MIAVLKSEAVLRLVFHRGSLIGVVAVILGSCALRVRPVGVAVAAPLLLALVLGHHSLGLGLVLGFGGFALLMALFFAISTVLLARQNRAGTGSG